MDTDTTRTAAGTVCDQGSSATADPAAHWSEHRRLYVLTVHRLSDRWIAVQQKFLRLHLPPPPVTSTYAVVDHPKDVGGFTRAFVSTRVRAACDEMKARHHRLDSTRAHSDHSSWLDFLFERLGDGGGGGKGPHTAVRARPRDTDLVLFCDNDAFPIASIDPLVARLEHHRLVAVVRSENIGDNFPHPCFALTTYGFWRSRQCTWAPHRPRTRPASGAPRWAANRSDPGSYLLQQCVERSIPWSPMLRSNVYNPDPLFFGLYDNVAYHHGAGSRMNVAMVHLRNGISKEAVNRANIQFRRRIETDDRFYRVLMDPPDETMAVAHTSNLPAPPRPPAAPARRGIAASRNTVGKSSFILQRVRALPPLLQQRQGGGGIRRAAPVALSRNPLPPATPPVRPNAAPEQRVGPAQQPSVPIAAPSPTTRGAERRTVAGPRGLRGMLVPWSAPSNARGARGAGVFPPGIRPRGAPPTTSFPLRSPPNDPAPATASATAAETAAASRQAGTSTVASRVAAFKRESSSVGTPTMATNPSSFPRNRLAASHTARRDGAARRVFAPH